jgi:hypothetical protein
MNGHDTDMYAALTDAELTALQDMLYAATEQAFRLGNPEFHADMARVFLEAGHTLVHRLCGEYMTAA